MRLFQLILFLILVNNSCIAQINLQQGLQLYLPFSGNANDASGNGNNAIVNGATLTTDEYGNANSAYTFNGVSDFMEVLNASNLQCKDSISMCAKVFVTGFYSGTCQSNVILQKKNDDFGSGHYSLRFGDSPYDADCSLFNPAYETFYGHMNNLGNFPVGSGVGQAGAAPYIATNQWYCVIYTWDHDTVRMYVNGVKRFQFNYNISNGNSTNNLFIGKRNDPLYPYYFKGKLDEIRIYNRALNPAEINAYCNVCFNIQNINSIISTPDTSICDGQSLQINTTTTLPTSYTYTWLPNATIANNTLKDITASPITTTSYYVKITDTNGCTNFDTIKVSILQKPFINAGADTSHCINGNVQLQAIGSGTFTWLPNANLSNNTIANPICSAPNAITYTVTLTDATGCQNVDSIQVFINPNPSIVIPAQYFYCFGAAPLQLTTAGSGNFSWLPATGLSNANINNPYASPSATTIYTVTLLDAYNCSASSVVTVAVNPSPSITVSTGDSICNGSGSNLLANGANSYFWNPSSSVSNAIINNPIATPSTTTIYTVTGTSTNNCFSTATVAIIVSPIINLQIVSTPDSTFCLGDSVQLIAYGGASYNWSPTNNTNVISNNSVKIWPTNSTTYTVVTANDFGCTESGTYRVIVQNPPIVTASKSADITCQQKTITLYANGALDYTWTNDGTLSNTVSQEVFASPKVNTIYTVTGVEGKCSVTATVQVFIQDQENKKIYIPNAITMNDDGVNDGFQVKSTVNFISFQLQIYNRFGQQVFSATDISKIWFGEQNGDYSKRLDTYYYYLKASDECGEIVRTGDITVIR